MYAAILPQAATVAVELLFAGRAANDLDAVFRRSSAWKAGAEHLVVASPAASHSAAACAEYLGTMAHVAESPAAGALQSCAGEALHAAPLDVATGVAAAGGRRLGATCALMTRFGSVAEADAFLQLPPCDALRTGDARCPGEALVDVVFELEAVEQEATSAVQTTL